MLPTHLKPKECYWLRHTLYWIMLVRWCACFSRYPSHWFTCVSHVCWHVPFHWIAWMHLASVLSVKSFNSTCVSPDLLVVGLEVLLCGSPRISIFELFNETIHSITWPYAFGSCCHDDRPTNGSHVALTHSSAVCICLCKSLPCREMLSRVSPHLCNCSQLPYSSIVNLFQCIRDHSFIWT